VIETSVEDETLTLWSFLFDGTRPSPTIPVAPTGTLFSNEAPLILRLALDRLETLLATTCLASAAGLSGLTIEPNVAEFGTVVAELIVVANMGLFGDWFVEPECECA
jgi:hypothetical protein